MARSDNTSRPALAREVLDLLVGDSERRAGVAVRLGAAGAWPAALALASDWNVLPAFHERLRELESHARAGAVVESMARARTAISALCSSTALERTATLQRELADANVPAVAIKGVAVIATLYGASSRRKVSDIDVVIRPSDLAAARTALVNAGYEDRSPPFERHVSDIAISRTLHNFARTFVRDEFEIDLHWQFGPTPPDALSAERIVERAVLAEVEGRTLLVAGPIETALIVVHHALRGGFARYSTVKDLVDLRAWWDVHGEREGTNLVEVACASGLGSSLAALCRALAARDPNFTTAPATGALETLLGRRGRAEARRLSTFLDDALRGESPDGETVALFAPRVYARSLLRAVSREVAWKARGNVPAAYAAPAARRPLAERAMNRLRRGWRIASELARVARLQRYRAVARAQSRFH